MAVYFFRWGDHIKIGKGTIPKRFKDHLTECKRNNTRLHLLAAVHGGRLEEDHLHRHFHEFNIPDLGRERFILAPPLLRYIRWLRDQYFVEVGDEWDASKGQFPPTVEVVDFDGWAPNEYRTKAPESLGPLLGLGPEDSFAARVLTGDDYYTPKEVMERVRECFGGSISLDPASHPVANRVVAADTFYGKQENGLAQPWFGDVWLNPPFEKWPAFAAKAVAEINRGEVRQLFALLSAPTVTTAYIAPLLASMSLMVVLRKRIEFWGPLVDDGNGTAASSGHLLLYYGKEMSLVRRAFSGEGTFWSPSP